MKQGNKSIFNKMAGTYNNSWIRSKAKERRVRRIVSKFGIKKGMTIVEAGAGSGQFTPFILEKTRKVILVDISDRMLRAAKKSLKVKTVKFMNASVSKIRLKRQSVGMVICFNSFPHFYPKQRVIKEFSRILKKKGILIISHTVSREYINKMHKKYGFDMKKHVLPKKAELKDMLEKNGFRLNLYYNGNYYILRAVKE